VGTHGQLVLLRQLVHAQNSNDILERLVILENLLNGSGDIIMLLANLQISSGTRPMESYKRH
jgi:hypothetical protein